MSLAQRVKPTSEVIKFAFDQTESFQLSPLTDKTVTSRKFRLQHFVFNFNFLQTTFNSYAREKLMTRLHAATHACKCMLIYLQFTQRTSA